MLRWWEKAHSIIKPYRLDPSERHIYHQILASNLFVNCVELIFPDDPSLLLTEIIRHSIKAPVKIMQKRSS